MKKLVHDVLSSNIMMALTSKRREGQQAKNGGDENAPDRQRHTHQRHATAARLQNRGYVVQAAHGEGDDKYTSDASISTMPSSTPGVPGMIACGGYSVQPAPVGPPGTKKLANSMIPTAGIPSS